MKFQAGCTVVAAAVEQCVNEEMSNRLPDDAAQQHLLKRAADGVCADWQ